MPGNAGISAGQLWMAADNFQPLSTASTAHPQSHPLCRWIASNLSTSVPRPSTASSTGSSTRPGDFAHVHPRASTDGAQHSHGLSTMTWSYPQGYPPSVSPDRGLSVKSQRVSQALHSRQVIYTGGHFSTRIGYLSTKTWFGRCGRCPVALERAAAAEAHALLLSTERFLVDASYPHQCVQIARV